ncbi:MAG: hypothetical protein GY842_06480 [bacterium]|nr:hypothetical protein [bacterium]
MRAFVLSSLFVAVAAGPARAELSHKILLGDCNADWSVDLDDLSELADGISGPGIALDAAYSCYDVDNDYDVDLRDYAELQRVFTGTQRVSVTISADADDGTEVDGATWNPDGYASSGRNRVGAQGAESSSVGLRFHLPEVRAGESFVYARLLLPGTGTGNLDTAASLRILGVDEDSAAGFDSARPSQRPKTGASTAWTLTVPWPAVTEDYDCSPLRRYSPDVSAVVNEVINRELWGQGPDGKTLALVVQDDGSSPDNYQEFQDHRVIEFNCPGRVVAPVLELYRTPSSTFIARESLGRPTNHSVTVNALSLLTLEAYLEYGASSGSFTGSTPVNTHPGGLPLEIVIDELDSDTRYYYRMRFRRPGDPQFEPGPERSFHTQRPPSSVFTFTIQSDSHLENLNRREDEIGKSLYRRALRNIAEDVPDFHIALGDTFHCESYIGRDVVDDVEAIQRHLDQRPFLDLVSHSAPFFFVIGNHEGEQGWRLNGTADNVAVWAANARKLIFPLPVPDSFYTGNSDNVPWIGLREDYYAWTWGDALFVVLDPYWYTVTKPHDLPQGPAGSGDRWDWTLGSDQYTWLQQTIQGSSATFKFVLAHQVTGGVDAYGRGGIEAASHALGGQGSYEWGGADQSGDDVFSTMRPGWTDPVQKIMAQSGVTIFFHGHDHVFVKQELDGVVYQECPQPADALYGEGLYALGGYTYGDKVDNSGHLRVTVSPIQVVVEYVRAWRPGDGVNGEVAYAYTIPASLRR